MKKGRNRTCIVFFEIIFVLLVVASVKTLACMMGQAPPKPAAFVGPTSYIMIGEVIGFTEPISDPNNFRGTAIGIKLKPVVSIQFPYHKNDYVELFMFHHDSDCFPRAIETRPALGMRYRLALNPATLVASQNRGSGAIRLESRVFDRVAIDEEMFGFSTAARTEFDYKNDLKTLYDKFSAPEMVNKKQWLDDFLQIETSKDLIRFRSSVIGGLKDIRLKLLERLLYNPRVDYLRLLSLKAEDFISLAANPSLIHLQYSDSDDIDVSKLGIKEKELLAERKKLESTGEVNFWRRY